MYQRVASSAMVPPSECPVNTIYWLPSSAAFNSASNPSSEMSIQRFKKPSCTATLLHARISGQRLLLAQAISQNQQSYGYSLYADSKLRVNVQL